MLSKLKKNKSIMSYQIVILAGGKGTRMESDLPKALMPLGGSTMIQTLLNNLDPKIKPIVVVGYKANKVKDVLNEQTYFALQEEQLGTGHAVMQCKDVIEPSISEIVVLYGDQPLVDQVMVVKLLAAHRQSGGAITMGVISVPDFKDWRIAYEKYGRVIRDHDNHVKAIVEYKDASDEVKSMTEVNPAYFVFNKEWLFENLNNLDNDNNQSEYYLTDLIKIAFEQGQLIKSVDIDPRKGLGANTKEQLQILEEVLRS